MIESIGLRLVSQYIHVKMLRAVVVVAIVGILLYFISIYMNGCAYQSDVRLDGKVSIVTGANTGIGKETVIDLVTRGARVYLGCRSEVRGQAAVEDIKKITGVSDDQIILLQLDLASLKSVRAFVDDFKQREKKLNILVNNAGIMYCPYSTTEDGFEMHFGVNHLGHFLLTTLLTDQLIAAAPSRVVTVSSMGHRFTSMNFDDIMSEKSYGKIHGYSQSKLANVLFAREYAKRMEGTAVTSYSLHPGAIKTELVRYTPLMNLPYVQEVLFFLAAPFVKDAWHGARTSVYLAVEPGVETHNGEYFSDCVPTAPQEQATDDNVARKLWDISIDLLNLGQDELHPRLR